MAEVWANSKSYEHYCGRWSRHTAREFVTWLGARPGLRWLDVGCGTGALSHAILKGADPARLVGVDRSFAYLHEARRNRKEGPYEVLVGDAQSLPVGTRKFDMAVSALVLNFVPNPGRMVAEMARSTAPGGRVGLYVWDYAGKMELMRYFWDAAGELDHRARELDEGRRFPVCNPDALRRIFEKTGLGAVQTAALDVPTVFRDFEDYWTPFTGGQGPAPGYTVSLDDEMRLRLRELIRSRLPQETDGTIRLVARSWAARGTVLPDT